MYLGKDSGQAGMTDCGRHMGLPLRSIQLKFVSLPKPPCFIASKSALFVARRVFVPIKKPAVFLQRVFCFEFIRSRFAGSSHK